MASSTAKQGVAMQPMSDERRRAFLLEGTRTGHLATTRADGSAHVAPVWFTLDGDDLVFMTGAVVRLRPERMVAVDDVAG
jgi:nitroimidazol reductase NimA-like FMN-containing flavoprotein (pyridoxamine 5'-phosphate oxidase superfamily)